MVSWRLVLMGVYVAVGLGYEALIWMGWAALVPRFPTPYAVPIFDVPFALVAVGIGYLCLERHRLRQDARSAGLGVTLWLTALLAFSHVLAQPDYPANPGINAGIAPYFFFLSYFAGLLGIGLAAQSGERSFPLTDRQRLAIGVAVVAVTGALTVAVLHVRPILPPVAAGRFTPFGLGLGYFVLATAGVWALTGGLRRYAARDAFGGYFLLAAFVWVLGLLGFLLHPLRYSIPWYLAGFARPLGVGVIFVGLLREQVWLYREARARQRELDGLYAELQARLAELQQTQDQLIQADKLKALGTLLSGVAHELNNPLSTILMSAQLMLINGALPDSMRARASAIESECGRASRIIRELLAFARRRPPERRRVDVNEVVRDVLKLYGPDLALKRIRVVSELDATVPMISADPFQLQQVLLNLFTNAAHAMAGTERAGVLRVHTAASARGVSIVVEDNGPGIPAEHLRRVFDPFFTTKPVGEGTGLGLSLCIGIIEAHDGRLVVDNVPTSGARFTIELPIGQCIDTVEAPTAGARTTDAADVLIVEDEPGLRSAVADLLTLRGHHAVAVGTGHAALEALARQPFDVIILDLRLPDLDGKAVWQWIGEHQPESAERVVFMTGDTLSAASHDFLENAGRPVLAKPVAMDELTRMVEMVLESHAGAIAGASR